MECGPENCPIIDPRASRKAKAKKLDEQGFSQAQIAAFLGVSQKTISKYLGGVYTQGINSPLTSKRGRKGEGRPRGSRKPKPAPQQEKVQGAVDALVRDGKPISRKGLAAQYGVGPSTVHVAKVKAEAKLETEPTITLDTLSLTAQQKLEMAIRQHKRKLDADFRAMIMGEVDRRMNETVLPAWKDTIDYANAVAGRDKGILTAAQYKLVRSCLHPDRVQDSEMKRKFAEAFSIIEALEKFLCKPEKEPPAKFPRTWQEAQSSAREREHTSC
jgi:hypothetical protein